MERKDYELIDNALKEAEKSVTPFAVVDNNEMSVVGDANETQKNIHDFEITFRVPEKNGDKFTYKTHKVEYKDIFITPRMDAKVVKAVTTIMPYFKKVKMDGSVGELTTEERRMIFESLDDEFYDAMYDVVATVLRIDKDLKDLMEPGCVLKALAQIIEMFPETINEADTFFE